MTGSLSDGARYLHLPPWQLFPAAQAFPHDPQFWGSFLRFTQESPHFERGFEQVQDPFAQA